MKKNFLLSVVLLCMVGLMAMAGSPVGKAKMVKKPTQRQAKVEGTYVAFFSDNGANASKWDSLWLAEAAKYVGKEKASEAVAKMKNKCNGTCIGSEAVRKFGAFANDNKDYRSRCKWLTCVLAYLFFGWERQGLRCRIL